MTVPDQAPSTIPSGDALDEIQLADFAFFGATWWPCASLEKLRIVTYFAIWLFIWDDEIDSTDGSMGDEFDAAQLYRDQTLSYIGYTLGLEGSHLDPFITNSIILSFAPIGEALKRSYTLKQRELVYTTFQFSIAMNEQEQRLRLSGTIPTVEDFWRFRLGSSCVLPVLAFNEFSWKDMDLPHDFHKNKEVESIKKYTNTLISAVNDLLSMKKEVKRGAIHSLVPIYLYHLGNLDSAVEEIVSFLASEVKGMDDAVASLFRRYETADGDVKRQVQEWVDGCKHLVTGNLTWSLETGRYGVMVEDGEIVMKL